MPFKNKKQQLHNDFTEYFERNQMKWYANEVADGW